MILRFRSILLTTLLLLFFLSGCGFEPGLSRDKKPPLSADIIVVGDGIGGLVASLEASRKGAAVIIFSGEPLAEDWLWEEGALCPEERADGRSFEDFLDDAGRMGCQKWHLALICERAAGDLEWLSRETGLKFSQEAPQRCLRANLSYDQVHRRLCESLQREGVRFIEGAVLEELLIQGGEISGVGFTDPAGVYNHIYAPAVILADGGFLDDQAWVEELAPGTAVAPWRSGGGESLKLAREAGLDLVEESRFAYTLAAEKRQGWMPVETPPGALAVVDEELIPLSPDRETELVQMLAKSPSSRGYMLLSGAGLKEKEEPDWPRYSDIGAFMEDCALELPELERYFRKGRSEIFAVRIKAVASYCLGGIAVDKTGRVLRNEEPVEGLYALGETAGVLNGKTIIPGFPLTEALVWGRRLGSTACRLLEP
ncbi:MAG: FAD-binding protein [Dethiobacteria bacterium]